MKDIDVRMGPSYGALNAPTWPINVSLMNNMSIKHALNEFSLMVLQRFR